MTALSRFVRKTAKRKASQKKRHTHTERERGTKTHTQKEKKTTTTNSSSSMRGGKKPLRQTENTQTQKNLALL